MAFACLDSIHQYDPPALHVKRPSAAWNRGAPSISKEHKNPMAGAPNVIRSARFEDFDLIEYSNLASSLPNDSVGPSREQTLECGPIESYAYNPSIMPDLTARHEENDSTLPPFEELLRGSGEAEDPQHTVSSVNYGSGRVDGSAEQPTPIDCNDPPTIEYRGDGDKPSEADGRSSLCPNSDSSTAAEQGGEQGSLNIPPISVSGSEVGAPTNREKSNNLGSASCPAPPPPHSPSPRLPPPAGTILLSISDGQTESSDNALKDIEHGPSGGTGGGKEKAGNGDGRNRDEHNGDGNERDGDRTAKGATRDTGTIGIRVSYKRTAGNADLNAGAEGVPRLEKVRRTDPIDEIDDVDKDMSDLEFARLRSLPKPIFRYPPSRRDFQQHKKTSSSGSSGAGDSQDNPLVLDIDDGKPGEAGAFIKATSVELETETAPLLSSHLSKDPKIFNNLDAPIITESPTEPLDPLTTPNLALIQHPQRGSVPKDNYGAVAVANTPTVISPPIPQQPPGQDEPASDEEGNDEWEIARIVGRRRTKKGVEYELDWRKTWKPASELGNAQRLIQEFEVRRRARGGSKVWRRA